MTFLSEVCEKFKEIFVEPESDFSMSHYKEGADAYYAGSAASSCPYQGEHRDSWMAGYFKR